MAKEKILEKIEEKLKKLQEKFNDLSNQKQKLLQTVKKLDEELLKTAASYNTLAELKIQAKEPETKEEKKKEDKGGISDDT